MPGGEAPRMCGQARAEAAVAGGCGRAARGCLRSSGGRPGGLDCTSVGDVAADEAAGESASGRSERPGDGEGDPGRLGPLGHLGRLGWWVCVLVIVLGVQPLYGGFVSHNEVPRLLQGISMASGEGPSLDAAAAGWGMEPGLDVSVTVDGRRVPNKPPGVSAVAALASAALGVTADGGDASAWLRLFAVVRALTGALPLLALGVALTRRGPRARRAWALLVLTTPLLAQTHLAFGHAAAAACVGLGFLALTAPVADGGDRGGHRELFAGLWLGLGLCFDYLVGVLAPVAAVVCLRRALRSRRAAPVALGLLGALPGAVALGAYHHAVFGGVLRTGYHSVVTPAFAEVHARGLLGLGWPTTQSLWQHWGSPWGGALWWAAPALLAGGCMAGAWRASADGTGSDADRSRLQIHAAGFAVALAVLSGLAQGGGWRVGPRYLVFALPLVWPGFLALQVWLGRAATRRSPLVVAAVALVVASAVLNGMAAALFPHLPPEGNPIGELLWPLAVEGAWSPRSVSAVLVIAATALVLFEALWPSLTSRTRSDAPLVLSRPRRVVLVMLAGVMGGVLAAAAAGQLPPAGEDEARAERTLGAVERLLAAP